MPFPYNTILGVGIGIDITQNQETAMPFPYNIILGVGTRQCRLRLRLLD